MALNALGSPLLLQASTQQLQDLMQGLQPGDLLKGRLVEILPQGKAVLSLQGQNLLAQLPPPSSGQVFQKGDLLLLQVTQAPAQKQAPQNSGQTPSSIQPQPQIAASPTGSTRPALVPQASSASAPTAAPSLTLRIMPQAATTAETAPVQSSSPRLSQEAAPLPPSAVLETALVQARVPVNQANLAVVSTLAKYGLPLDPATVTQVIQQADSLLATEQNWQSSPAPKNSTLAPVPQPVQILLTDALPALRMAVQSTPVVADKISFQQATQVIEMALRGERLPLEAPQAPLHPESPKSVPAQAPVSAAAAETPQQSGSIIQLNKAIQTVLSKASPENLQALKQAVQSFQSAARPQAEFKPAPALEAPRPANARPVRTEMNAILAPLASEESLPTLPAQREAIVQWTQALDPQPKAPLSVQALKQSAVDLQVQWQDPQSPASQNLVRAVQVQAPELPAPQILQSARQTLQVAVQALEALPIEQVFSGPQSLNAELEAQGLPAPKLSLNSVPRELVYEAVAWLHARDLPPQRPLVEAAVAFLSSGKETLKLAQSVVEAEPEIPADLFRDRPALKEAFTDVRRALLNASVDFEQGDIAVKLREWPASAGLQLESSAPALPKAAPAPLQAETAPAPPLKQALMVLQHELKQALRSPEITSDSGTAAKLESVSRDTNNALQSLGALPLQAQPTPAYHTVTLPLALPMQGPLNNGQLSVTWRHGRERGLDEKEPVNVAVSLNTESLGEVRVLLQVWKGAANATVKAADAETRSFLESGADELRAGFAERTPFKLQNLGFDVIREDEAPAPADPGLPTSLGFNFSA